MRKRLHYGGSRHPARRQGARLKTTVPINSEVQQPAPGERAFKILQEELDEGVIKATKSGLRIELDE